jgi:asparagine synthase (glutamine-hydrolysing)
MCGIAGIAPFNQVSDKVEIKKMIGEIIHRGPDQKIIFKNSLGVFGFVRLNIIDLSNKSNQPFFSNDKKIQIIYNGEIYNYKSLKQSYFKNTNFKSNGDGEVLVHLYEKYGIKFLDKVKGMFSICIIDENLKKIYLVRDRFGIKPLYFRFDKNQKKLFFCSEINPLANSNKFKKKLNINEANKFLTQGLVNSNSETWFKDIHQVKAAHYIELFNERISEKKYYHIEDFIDEKKISSFKENISNFKNKIQNSFIEHNQFDVKAGIHLSGGVDSAVLAGISNFNQKKYQSFTFDFNDKNIVK